MTLVRGMLVDSGKLIDDRGKLQRGLSINHKLKTINQLISQLLREEKDEASLLICFWQDSLDAFIPRFA